MKWLLNVVIKFLTRDDPKLIPIQVRAALALLIIANAAVTEIAVARHLSLLRSLAALSIVWGVFAVGLRIWPSTASNQDLQKISNQIVKMGSSTKLSIWDSASVIAFAHLSFFMAFLLSAVGVLIAKYHPSQLKIPIWLALLEIWMIYFPCPAILVYVRNKMGRCLCSRWRARLQGDTSNAEIKRILNLMSYAITVVVGVSPVLNLLFQW
jgi:hypothetical protein